MLVVGVSAAGGVAFGAEPVEGRAHVHLFAGGHVEESEVNRGAAGVAAARGYVVEFEEAAFVDVRVEVLSHKSVVEFFAPADEVVNGGLRTVGVVDLDAVAHGEEFVAYGFEAVGCDPGKESSGFVVAVDAAADEVVGAMVAYFENGVGDDVGDADEVGSCRDCGRVGRAFGCRRDGLTVMPAGGKGQREQGRKGDKGCVFHNI